VTRGGASAAVPGIALGVRIPYGLRRIDRLAKRSAVRTGRARKLALGLAALGLAACGHAPAPAAAGPAAPVPDKTVQVNRPGEPVDVAEILPAGYVTVVDFWSESCHACTALGGMLAVGVAQDRRIVIRKIDVGDGFTPVAQAYQIDALPHFFIYDKRRRLRYDLVGGDCLDAAKYARLLAAE
jgi:hypothetical protein